ncbi:4Fe-4S cluster-binding domain-containing protein [Peptoniphilus equinus]|uniref:4Fe-4S cluster-binding domain-containing protein n=1 Tax=Peptoniphilus equinus TaxID=3016343 RepID=A0ABY7QTC9_9FIRM|nr:radical SAM protein [Peptoniphilus equinus]WBW49403.1 4Fe-4S cluster-binding domain-containing protein [Peptoniphilus equinus]
MKTMNYEQIRLIRGVDSNILFDGANGDLYFLDDTTAKLLQFYMDKYYYFINDEEFITAMKDVKIIDKEFDINEIESIFENRKNTSEKLDSIYRQLNELEKYSSLSINVSEKCNFDCIYCFGDGGNYGRKESLMSWEVAKKIIDHWIENINPKTKIYYVNFFGGEPFLNIELIEKVVSYLNSIEKLKRKIQYIVTTNGSIFNTKIRNLLNSNNFEISISIDGLYFIHNKNRPDKSRMDTFDNVLINYHKFSKCAKSLSAQITVNKKDIKYLFDSVNYLWSKGVKRIYINLVFDENVIYDECDFIDYNLQLDKLLKVTFDNLKNNRDNIYCNIYDLAKKYIKRDFL